MSIDKNTIWDRFLNIQDSICEQVEILDGKSRFHQDEWEREGGGGGRTRVIRNGDLLEKGGVNFSAVFGSLPEKTAREFKVEPGLDFFATGVSIVLHPFNPHVPIIHMNIRYFELGNGDCWFGGGIDLTPHYIDEKEAGHFHRQLKTLCDQHHPEYYSEFKRWADDYFYIEHREETRGVGGIFFDHLRPTEEISLQERFNFVTDVGKAFAPIYKEIAEPKRSRTFSDKEKEWQLLRRGRYVEFNLVYDRGTRFGLQSKGRIESILMSLPAHASWYYDHQPEKGSDEARTLSLLRKDIDWADRINQHTNA